MTKISKKSLEYQKDKHVEKGTVLKPNHGAGCGAASGCGAGYGSDAGRNSDLNTGDSQSRRWGVGGSHGSKSGWGAGSGRGGSACSPQGRGSGGSAVSVRTRKDDSDGHGLG